MISPDGFAIRPRSPASWRICCSEPRAPESAMMKIGLNDGPVTVSPLSFLPKTWVDSPLITAPPIWS